MRFEGTIELYDAGLESAYLNKPLTKHCRERIPQDVPGTIVPFTDQRVRAQILAQRMGDVAVSAFVSYELEIDGTLDFFF